MKIKCRCATCGLRFERNKSQIKSARVYCSPRCRHEGLRRPVVRGSNAGLRAAYALGYRPTSDGRIVGPDGEPVPLNPNKAGYLYFSAKTCRCPLAVHRFVALHLYGEEALEAECVRHRDDVKHNNAFENITYGTRRQNCADVPTTVRRERSLRANHWRRRFTDDQVRQIRQLIREGWSLKRLRERFGGGYGSLASIRDGITYREIILDDDGGAS